MFKFLNFDAVTYFLQFTVLPSLTITVLHSITFYDYPIKSYYPIKKTRYSTTIFVKCLAI